VCTLRLRFAFVARPYTAIVLSTRLPIMAEVAGVYVGLVASIGTLLQLSEIVVEYLCNTARATEQKRRLLNEIVSTNALLDDLKRKAQAPEWGNTLGLLQPQGSLELFKSVLQELETKARLSNNRFLKVTKRLIFHFEKEEYEKILAKIERSKSTFMMALGL
jgi:F0F1-type ATP synthase delta subunit